MGRRKKESQETHRENIAAAAERLFSKQGVAAATMDSIAREAGYSKATLYVYFKNKEEIVGYLVLKSMRLLALYISQAISRPRPVREKYMGICNALSGYQEKYPYYFLLALGEINVNLERKDCLLAERETYAVGEQINSAVETFIREGIADGAFQPDIPVLQTVFLFWSTLAGLIQTATDKANYIQKTMGMSRRAFLDFGFEQLYKMIERREE